MAKSDIPTAKSIAHIDKSQGDDRKALRATCLERRNTIDPGLKLQYDTAIIARLIDWLDKHPPAKQSDALLALWWPIGSEPDWRSFASQLRRLGWQLALPCVTGKNLPLSFARYDEDTVLRCAGLGIFEPAQVQRINPGSSLRHVWVFLKTIAWAMGVAITIEVWRSSMMEHANARLQ